MRHHTRPVHVAHRLGGVPSGVVLGVGTLLLAFALLLSRSPLPPVGTTISLTVRPGQSLWAIADAHPVPGLDTAQTVELIASLNALQDAAISPGDTLHIPVSVDDSTGIAMR